MPTPWRAVSTSVLDQLDDTALAVTDTGGSGQPVVCLDGSYANQAHWRHVVGTLGDGYRHITFDERARGKSRRSADYSFEGCIRDVDACSKPGTSPGRSWSAGRPGRAVPSHAVAAADRGAAGPGRSDERRPARRVQHRGQRDLVRNPNLSVSAKVASNHSKILRNDYRAVADAISGLTAARHPSDS